MQCSASWSGLTRRQQQVWKKFLGIILPVTTRSNFSLDVRELYGFTNVQKYAENGTNHAGNLIVSLGYSYELTGI